MGDRYTTVLTHTAEVLLLSPSTLVYLSLEDADGLSGAFAGGGGHVLFALIELVCIKASEYGREHFDCQVFYSSTPPFPF